MEHLRTKYGSIIVTESSHLPTLLPTGQMLRSSTTVLLALMLSACNVASKRAANSMATPISCHGIPEDTVDTELEWRTPWPEVPDTPPTYVPAEVTRKIYAPSNLLRDSEYMTGTYPRNIIWLYFKRDATKSERQAAVDLINGQVVGGAPFHTGGVYYIRIDNRDGPEPLFEAIRQLETLSQVDRAMPDLACSTSNL